MFFSDEEIECIKKSEECDDVEEIVGCNNAV
jgi:hypothetical protein